MKSFEREFSFLETLFDDLQQPEYVAEFLAVKASIEVITATAPVEPLPVFPEWTQQYGDYLVAHLSASEEVAC